MTNFFGLPARLFALASLLLVGGCDQSRDLVPMLVLAKGSVKANGGAELRPGARLTAQRSLATGDDGFAGISLLPGVVFCLDANSRAELLPARLVKHDDQVVEREARVRLLAGRGYLRVAALEGRTMVRVETVGGEVRAVGETMAEIQIEPAERGGAIVTCCTGLIHASGVEVPAGSYSVSENGMFRLARGAEDEKARWERVLAAQQVEGVVESIFSRQRALRP
ncbi:MAG: hypothetical protein JSR82_14700 [Verrucomicrobia bacterium]|nr:hypothetical protein [Verrucomicrobiota bacterium]